ncbi:diadenylate cyclase CdaA [Dielma fastidiosa]|uniref:diadenylate cyclase CdaA n=1 Tax=Dielma fastidiosa TaxID=1034346 RepID=UPI000EDDC30A|nr:diadenylate cyclase CdaA [Dielma fastidiosa]HAH95013.1 TIGR00159 family protein [Dielma fastidiosa]
MFNYITTTNITQIIRAIIDIMCVWVVIYYGLKIVRNNSRTIQIFKGIIFVIIVQAFAKVFKLPTIESLAAMFIAWGPLALIILFQPEIRNVLEKLGKTNVFSRISTLTVNERENLVDELVKAAGELSATQTGALISLEQSHSLSDYIKTGTKMNSIVTSELLCSIFVPGTPLHDGAVIIQGDKIACASAYFPPTTFDFPSSYGARHRAAIGISEITDSISIVVSEETGTISIAEGGKLHVMSVDSLREYLMMVICHTENEIQKDNQIKKDYDDEIEFSDGVEAEEHKGPKITAHLMKKSVKKFGKRKAGEEVKAEEAEKPVEAAEELEETQEVAEEIVYDQSDSETEGGE